MNVAEIMMVTGQSDPSFQNSKFIPKLSINHQADDEDGNSLPRGQWKVAHGGKDIFSKVAKFRIYKSTYQYSVYDPQTNKYPLTSVQFVNWGEPCIDNTGNEHKAAGYKKAVIKAFPQYEKSLRCERLLYGTVDLDDLKNIPCFWPAKGENFRTITDVLDGLTKQNKLMAFYPLTMTSERKKNGGNTYFTASISVPDVEDLEGFDMQKFTETLKVFDDAITSENDKIIAEFNKKRIAPSDSFAKAFHNDSMKGDVLEVVAEEVQELNDPLDDIS